MKAAVVEQIGEPLVIHSDWPDPECEATDAVLRVEANGICLTDYHVWHGGWPWVGIQTPVPIVLGHEYCGVVEEVGAAVQGFKKGDRVVVPFNHSCGICEQCRDGHENVCLDVRFPMFHYTGRLRPVRQGLARGRQSRAAAGVDHLRGRRRHGLPLHDVLARGGRSGQGDGGRVGRGIRLRRRRAWRRSTSRVRSARA